MTMQIKKPMKKKVQSKLVWVSKMVLAHHFCTFAEAGTWYTTKSHTCHPEN